MRAWFSESPRRWLLLALPIVLVAFIGVFLVVNQEMPFTVQEHPLEGEVIASDTQQPLGNASVKLGDTVLQTDENGRYAIEQVKSNATLEITAPGYRQVKIKVGSNTTLTTHLSPLVIQGILKDAETGQPINGATIAMGGATTTTDAAGHFQLQNIKEQGPLQMQAPGYAMAQLDYQGQETVEAILEPSALLVKVVDAANNQPLAGTVSSGEQRLNTDAQGQAKLTRLTPGSKIKVEAPNYSPLEITYTGQPQAEARLYQGTLVGKILDELSGQPLVGALVTDGKNVTTTGQDGSFKLENVPADALMRVRIHGYDRATINLAQERPAEIKLRPRNVRALYLTYYGVGNEDIREHALQVIEETEANAVVIDVKGDRGWLVYKSEVPLAQEIGAIRDVQIEDIKGFLNSMKEKNIYTIARIVTFKDNILAEAHPELAVHDANGGLWIDGEGLAWLDPFQEAAWDYNIDLAVEAANLGFDEIQFDYIRFPTDPSAGTTVDATVFSGPNKMANRVEAMSGFLKKADEALKPTGAALAVDIFGYVTWRTDDMGIGQHLETLAQQVDYICPMVYPTLFWDGIPRTDGGPVYAENAPAYPYEIVHLSMKTAAERIKGSRAQLRPWLQYYNDYILDIPYGANEINLQKQATYDTNLDGWMMWDPSNQYIKGGFASGD